jgi:hypothetical protein
MLFSFLFLNISAQKNGANKAENKKEYIKDKKQKSEQASESAAKRHHFGIQTKKVQKRIREDDRKTKKYYNKKLHRSFLSILFGKKKRN